jgi:hypothetical protein
MDPETWRDTHPEEHERLQARNRPRHPVPGTDGYVRQSADGRWSWKCDGCSTANSPYDTKLDASEALEDHAEDCPA